MSIVTDDPPREWTIYSPELAQPADITIPAPIVEEPVVIVAEVEAAGVAPVSALPRAPAPAYDDAAILALLAAYDWPLDQAIAVMLCESGGRPDAYNASGATGLFQIHPHRPEMFDPAANVAAAYAKYRDGVSSGNAWKHWNQWGGCGHF